MTCIEIILMAILSLNPEMKESKALRFAKPICTESISAEIDPLIVVSIIHHESNFSTRSVMHNNNGSLDLGVMQFNCKTNLDEIYLKWRKYWCNPKRRNYLQSIEGGIKAGVRELRFWKNLCESRHNSINLKIRFNHLNFHYSKLFKTNSNHLQSLLVSSKPVSIGESLSLLDYSTRLVSIYLTSQSVSTIKNDKLNHWWIQHYNWNSEFYSLRVMYVYLSLYQDREDIYHIVRTRAYTRIKELNNCLQHRDMCLKEYELWVKKKQQKKLRRLKRRKLKSKRLLQQN